MRRLEAETCQLVSLKVQNFQSFESFKRVHGDPAQLVPLKMKVTQGREAGELPVEELLQLVVLQVEHLHPGQAFQAERSDREDVAVVQENLDRMASSYEPRSDQLRHVVAIKVDLSGVHGNKAGTSMWLLAEHLILFDVHCESWKQEQLSGHCMRQWQAKKSQQKQSGWQWAEYLQSKSELGIETRGTLEDEQTTELRSPIVGIKPPVRPGFFAGLLFHEREQSQFQGLSASKSLGS